MPWSASHACAVAASVTARGTENTVPKLARMALGFHGSLSGSATITASTPAPSAERTSAPRLPGFSTASTTATSGSSGSVSASSDTSGWTPTASNPSERSPKAIRPMSSALTATMLPPASVAACNARRASEPAWPSSSWDTNSSRSPIPDEAARSISRAPSMSINPRARRSREVRSPRAAWTRGLWMLLRGARELTP